MDAAEDGETLEREASRVLALALERRNVLFELGERDLFRERIERAIEYATRACAEGPSEVSLRARLTLLRAHTERALDARYGAGQLSRSAQRAPTVEACEEGWSRVEAIIGNAERSASVAASLAMELGAPSKLRALVKNAERAAHEARKISLERNDAYTFHTDPRFSFGEGWHVAAAAVLAGARVQVEPDKPATAAALQFMNDAGLESQLQQYRSRPRAMKQTSEIIARAFRSDAAHARRLLRESFLGNVPISASVIDWANRRLVAAEPMPKVLVWVRKTTHDPERNTSPTELSILAGRIATAGLMPILIGDAIDVAPKDAVDLTMFWASPVFGGLGARRAQLQLFEHLRAAHDLVGQIGVTTAAMDGPALLGLSTLYVTEASNVRMREWVGAVPGFHEVTRTDDYLERVSDVLRRWASLESRLAANDDDSRASNV